MNTYLKKEVEIRYGDPLPGNIYNFDVDATRINELGVKFKSINEVYEVLSRGLLL